MKARSFLKTSVIAAAFLCLSPLVKAQPGGSGPDPDPNGSDVPLDLGIITLVAVGAGYAAKRKYDATKKEKAAEQVEK